VCVSVWVHVRVLFVMGLFASAVDGPPSACLPDPLLVARILFCFFGFWPWFLAGLSFAGICQLCHARV